MEQALTADFYDRPVVEVAVDLLGCLIVHGDCVGRIVETEAYHDSEPACHAYVGLTPRTKTLFDSPGKAYVYRSYGIHALLNAVCEEKGVGAAVLIRALEPIDGFEAMRSRRKHIKSSELCNGPGKLTQALGIELTENDSSLQTGPIRILPSKASEVEYVASQRIGITKAVELPWRFTIAGSPFVSRPHPIGQSQRRQLVPKY